MLKRNPKTLQEPYEVSAEFPRGDLPLRPCLVAPIALLVAFVVSVSIHLGTAPWWLGRESGFFEHGTVLVLLIGVAAGAYAVAMGSFLQLWLRGWILAWTLASFYFAGEEASWGQHYFGWQTPELFDKINKQDETNFHNTSSWLNMKPRTGVELWMLVGGVVVPLLRSRNLLTRNAVAVWFWPTLAGITTVAANFLLRICDAVALSTEKGSRFHAVFFELGNSEPREFFIALFLSIWLCGIGLGVRGIRRTAQA